MQNNFLLTTPELDDQLVRIQQAIRLSMNGIVADSMTEHGIRYKKSYGVTILRLKEIARNYTPGYALAQRLWLLGIRETMILATLLAPAATFPEKTALEWSEECTNQELIEQANMNLFQHLPYSVPFVLKCIDTESAHLQSFGFTLALRVSSKMAMDEMQQVLDRGLQLAATPDSYLIKTIASCLARFCRTSSETAQFVRERVSQSTDKQSNGAIVIRKFVDNELIFLGYEPINS